MVHGLAANRLNLDLDERYSVARAARARGFDVYILELRGAGLSRPPGGRDRSLFSWGFSDYSERDVPTAIAALLERTGARALHGFGHSMGGMLLYAYATRGGSGIRSLSSLGAPLVGQLHIGARERRIMQLATRIAPGAPRQRMPLRRLFGAAGRFMRFSSLIIDGMLVNGANVDSEIMTRLAREAIDDIPLTLLQDFTSHMNDSVVGRPPFGYELELHRIDRPILAIGGAADRVASPRSVAALVERLRSPDLRYREFGVRHGDRADYGHVDLLVGRSAPEDIYPMLLDFWEETD